MKKWLYTLLFVGVAHLVAVSQVRYLEDTFTDVNIISDIEYAANISILPIVLGESDSPMLDTLVMDIYEPAGDTIGNRPVVILAHAGDFLPAIVNQSPYGQKEDFAVAETCRQLARKGYVAISMEYRIGFNPFGSEEELKAGVLQASYRLGQDMRTLVRWVRKSVAEDGNPYRLDSARIAVGGFDSAGWGAANVGHLKRIEQVTELAKFVNLGETPPTPFVTQEAYGDPYGIVAAPLNNPNYPTYSSEVSATINIEGGVGDISWIEAGDPPMIAFQRRWTFPRGIRDVTLAATGSIIIADGAFLDTLIYTAQELGNQDVFDNDFLNDDMTSAALDSTNGLRGLMLYNGFTIDSTILCDPTPGSSENSYGRNSYPWNAYDSELFSQFWDGAGQNPTSDIFTCQYNASEGNVNDPVASAIFIDSMINYMTPRLMLAMDLVNDPTSVDNSLKPALTFQAFPNPAHDQITFQANNPIERVALFDLQGRVVAEVKAVQQKQFQLNTSTLSPGIYFAKVYFEAGIVSEKIQIQ